MKHVLKTNLIAFVLLTACTSAPTAIAPLTLTPLPTVTQLSTSTPPPTTTSLPSSTPTAAATQTSTPTQTNTPTTTATATPTPKPTIIGLKGVTYPDAQFLSGEVQLYAKTMGLNATNVAKGISYRQFSDKNGLPFVVAITADNTPLLLYDSANGWREATRGELGTKKGMLIGIDARGWKIALGDKRYINTLVSDANHFQMDDMCDWSRFERDQGTRAYTIQNPEISYALNLARQYHKTLSAGCGIIWGYPDAIPTRLKNGQYTQEQLLAIAEQHIETFLAPIKNDVQRVAVVNEAIPHLLGIPNFWIDTNHIDRDVLLQRSFRKARQIVPNAELSLREYSVEFAGYPRSDEFFNLIKRLNDEEKATNDRNLIDAAEFQLPLLGSGLIGKDPAMDPNNFIDSGRRAQMMEKLRNNIRRFRAIGVNVYITELLLPVDSLPGTLEQKLDLQASIYGDIYRVCAEEGVGVGLFVQNWSQDTGYPPGSTWPYPRDDNYNPLPSYYAINAAILSTIK